MPSGLDIPIQITITPANVDKTSDDVIRAFRDIERRAQKAGLQIERGFKKGFTGIRENVRKLRRQFDFLNTGVAKFAGLLTGAGLGGIALFAKRSLETADNIAKVADRVGFTTDQLQALRLAAELNGVSIQTLDMALQRFSRRIGEVDRGTGELLKTAEAYGFETRDQEGRVKENIVALKEWADIIANTEDVQGQLATTMKLVDSEGARLVNLFRQGADAITRYEEDARRFGITLDEFYVRKSEEAVNVITILQRQLQTTFTSLVVDNAQQIAEAVGNIVEWISRLTGLQTRITLQDRLSEINEELQTMQQTTGAGLLLPDIADALDVQTDAIEGDINRREGLLAEREEIQKRLEFLDEQFRRNLERRESEQILVGTGRTAEQRRQLQELFSIFEEVDRQEEILNQQRQKRLEQRQSELEVAQSSELDSWRQHYNQRFEIRSRALGAEIELEKQAAEQVNESLENFFADIDRAESRLPEVISEWASLAEKTARSMERSFSDIFFNTMRGEFQSLSDLADSVLSGIQREIANIASRQLVGSLFGDLAGGTGGGLLQDLIGGLQFHDGSKSVPHGGKPRLVPKKVFRNAKRYHQGLRPNEFAAIIEKGEEITPRGQRSGPTIVNNFVISENSPMTRRSSLQISEDVLRSLSSMQG